MVNWSGYCELRDRGSLDGRNSDRIGNGRKKCDERIASVFLGPAPAGERSVLAKPWPGINDIQSTFDHHVEHTPVLVRLALVWMSAFRHVLQG